MATLIRERDWSLTPLGPIESWPQSLRTTVSLCLASNFPINIIWGPERNQIYNDGYRIICGEAHPRSLGEDYRVTWESAWPALSAPFDQAVAGSASYLENQRMFLSRNGYLEETFFTFSLSPIRDESGGIGGLFHPVSETTPTILSERRTRALRDLNAKLGLAKDMAELGTAIVETLGQFEFDLPCVFVYATDGHGYHALAANGLETDPREMPWPFAAAAASGQLVEVEDLQPIIRDRRCGPYEEGPARGVLLPITIMGSAEPPMMVALGVSPRLPYDESYRGFLDLLGSTITAALRTVRAREDERRRLEALAEIDRAKTTFFSNVSHEFRTPLTLMLAPLEETLAKPGDLAGDIRDRIELAHRNAVRLLKLVNTLLDFSRMETGRTDASFQKTDIAAYTMDLASNFRSVIETAGLDFVVEAEPVSEQVYLDRDMFEKIVLNLLSNAFKFTHEGEIRVQVRGDTVANSVHIVVSDTGIGIAEQEVPRLFDRFHRVAGAKGRSFEGSGIGLSLVRELVDAHGGTIDVASMPGMGTTFTISIPMGMHHLPADRIKEGPAASAASSKAGPFIDEALGGYRMPTR
jgi:signal transduction histidine kinase